MAALPKQDCGAVVTNGRPVDRALSSRVMLRAGVALLLLAPALWLATYLPPGTMTSVSLLAMAAIASAVLGLVSVVLGAVIRPAT